MKKTMILFLLALCLMLTINCAAENAPVVFRVGGLNISVPAEYAGLLVIEIPENSDGDILFTVSERASIEAAKANGETFSGAGWLFSIGRVSAERYHEMLCDDMSGAVVFARGADDGYYMYYHPTDVRMVREDYTYIEEDLKEWGALNEWAWSMRTKIIEENGLTPESHGNTEPDIYLARMLYRDGEKYTVSTTEYGPMESNGVKADEYIGKLFTGVTYEPVYDEEAPDGEYVVLNFPDDDIRFDFFLQEGKENYIRQVWNEGRNEQLYLAEFEDETIKASAVMHDLYLDMVLADSLGYTPDDMIGIWYEKIAGRCGIEISKGSEEGIYNVLINWGAGASETVVWTMTAKATGKGAELRYTDGKMSDIVFSSADQSTETVMYEDGTGSFDLLSTYELVWNDETGHAADNLLYVKER